MTYRDFESLLGRTASDKLLHDKAFDIAINQKYNGYQRCLASMVYKFFDKKSAATHTGTGINSNSDSEN